MVTFPASDPGRREQAVAGDEIIFRNGAVFDGRMFLPEGTCVRATGGTITTERRSLAETVLLVNLSLSIESQTLAGKFSQLGKGQFTFDSSLAPGGGMPACGAVIFLGLLNVVGIRESAGLTALLAIGSIRMADSVTSAPEPATASASSACSGG